MSDPERGAYTPPTDAPLAFDARRPARGGGGRPMPLTLVVSALVLIALIGAVFFFYRSGVRGAEDAPQPVGDPVGAFIKPATDEAQPTDPAAGLQIYNQDDAAPAEPTFAPGPEQPQPRPTVPVQEQKLPPVVIAQAPPQPAPATALKGPTTPAATPAPAPAPKAPATATPAPKAATGAFAVQIGAFSSASIADTEWRAATAGVSGKGKQVDAIQRDGKTLYRTAVTGFTTRDQAAAFCNQLKAAGKSCFVR